MIDDGITELGFYGKLPTYGDFITRRMPKDFQHAWHEWVATSIGAAREAMPDDWRTYYLNCPAWKFVIGAGLCGEQAVAGVTIPSVDKVGRYFNFTLAALLPHGIRTLSLVNSQQDWFASVEEMALRTLDEEMDQDQLDIGLEAISSSTVFPQSPGIDFEEGAGHFRSMASSMGTTIDQLEGMLHNLVAQRFPDHSFWWHDGSANTPAQILCCEGLPNGERYLAMLVGDVEQYDPEEPPPGEPDEEEVDYLDQILSS
jgi:type VI secretion system protein ImpM